MNLMPTPDHSLLARLQSVNERVVLAVGILVFFAAVLLSIATRWYLEARSAAEIAKLVPEKIKERSLVKGDILVPVILSIKLQDGRATLRGMLPDEAAHQTVLARAREIYGYNVEDNLGIQSGIVVTPWFDSVLKWFPPRVNALNSGEINVSGMKVLLFGQVPTVEARIAAGRTLAKLVGAEGQFFNELQVSASAQTQSTSLVNSKVPSARESKLAPARIQF